MHRIEPASRAILPTPPDDIRESTVVSTEELQGLRDRHPNVLIAGPSAALAAAISEIYPLLRPPVTSVRIDRHAVLHLTLAPGTVILRNIAALNRVEQERLRDWLARMSATTQVVATSTTPVFPLVERGAFLDSLYYRLNMTYFEVGGLRTPQA